MLLPVEYYELYNKYSWYSEILLVLVPVLVPVRLKVVLAVVLAISGRELGEYRSTRYSVLRIPYTLCFCTSTSTAGSTCTTYQVLERCKQYFIFGVILYHIYKYIYIYVINTKIRYK
jgi:hypothetical protein